MPSMVRYDISGLLSRFDVRVKLSPLTGPIVSDFAVPVDATAFHAVGPVDVGVHGFKDGVDVAGVEVFVGGGDEVVRGLHGFPAP